jgi:uncharacterized protein YbcI
VRVLTKSPLLLARRTLASRTRNGPHLAFSLMPEVLTGSELARWTMVLKNSLTGDKLLHVVSETVVALHERHLGRRPASARTMIMGDDLVACVLTGVYTEVEKTMIELGRQPVVEDIRQTFYAALRETFIDEIRQLSGRRVVAFFATQHVGQDREILLFQLGPSSEPGG